MLTDVLEVHFLEIPKLFDEDIERDENDPIVQFIESIALNTGERDFSCYYSTKMTLFLGFFKFSKYRLQD